MIGNPCRALTQLSCMILWLGRRAGKKTTLPFRACWSPFLRADVFWSQRFPSRRIALRVSSSFWSKFAPNAL